MGAAVRGETNAMATRGGNLRNYVACQCELLPNEVYTLVLACASAAGTASAGARDEATSTVRGRQEPKEPQACKVTVKEGLDFELRLQVNTELAQPATFLKPPRVHPVNDSQRHHATMASTRTTNAQEPGETVKLLRRATIRP